MHSRRLGILDETRAYQERQLDWPNSFLYLELLFYKP